MTLLVIVLGTLLAGIGSVWLAAWLSFGVISHHTRHMLSLAAGALLATAFLHLLPEALDQGGSAEGGGRLCSPRFGARPRATQAERRRRQAGPASHGSLAGKLPATRPPQFSTGAPRARATWA